MEGGGREGGRHRERKEVKGGNVAAGVMMVGLVVVLVVRVSGSGKEGRVVVYSKWKLVGWLVGWLIGLLLGFGLSGYD